MVVTLQSAFGGIKAENAETQAVINQMLGYKSEKQIVAEFFGLREEIIYDADGINIVDMNSDFKNPISLKEKKVRYHEKLRDFGIDESKFKLLFPYGLPEVVEVIETLETNDEDNGTNTGTEPEPRNTPKFTKTKKK